MLTLKAVWCLFCFLPTTLALWPIPRGITTGSTGIKLSPTFNVVTNIHGRIPQDLSEAITRSQTRLKNDTFERLVLGRGSADSAKIANAPHITCLTLSLSPGVHVKSISEEATVAIDSREEGYVLTVPASGAVASLTANSTLGLFRGLTTFEQLWYTYKGEKYILNAPVIISDQPAFPYRGFSLDTSRNFYPVSDILRTLDAMSWVKMSILYWHVADSQSFPLSLSKFPQLAAKGAYSEEEVYTESDVRQIVKFANERGIDVVMELDTPGHTTAIGAAYPEHIACLNKSPWSKYANEPPAGQLRIASNATISFVETLFQTVIGLLNSTMMSSGGDEVNLPCWMEDEETVADLEKDNGTIAEALNQFIGHIQEVMKKNNKRPFIKSDMILTHNVPVTNDTVAVVWQTSADAAAMASRGVHFIHQPSNYFYLDCGAGDWVGNNVLGNSWCDPFKTWQRAYSFDPFANLTTEQHSLVLGGQMPLWSEQSSSENLDPIVWPRLAVAAEVFWTGATLPDGTPRVSPNATSGTAAFDRLNELRYRLVDRGVKAIALQPKWCILRPGDCDVDA
ncbi:N-acetylhexosaminidase [Panus rudis PR-1116 ss-1]|nr:N-acetylhexosaminidase [Panus rudis PR-1116 ss-1]